MGGSEGVRERRTRGWMVGADCLTGGWWGGVRVWGLASSREHESTGAPVSREIRKKLVYCSITEISNRRYPYDFSSFQEREKERAGER